MMQAPIPIEHDPITCAEAMRLYQAMLDHPAILPLIYLFAIIGVYFIASRVAKALWLIGSGLYSSIYFAWKGKPL